MNTEQRLAQSQAHAHAHTHAHTQGQAQRQEPTPEAGSAKRAGTSGFHLREVGYTVGGKTLFDGLSLDVPAGEFVALVGPSGCGKSTLLHLLAGHIQPSHGLIERPSAVRVMYQKDGLLPWLNAVQNVQLGLRHLYPAQQEQEALMLLRVMGLEAYARYYPHQLSGGMQQRVALARVLAGPPSALLLDEPFSALDYLTRLRLRKELAVRLEAHPRTVVLTTHDLEEAVQLADRVLLLSPRPARVEASWILSGKRPREVDDPSSLKVVKEILAKMG